MLSIVIYYWYTKIHIASELRVTCPEAYVESVQSKWSFPSSKSMEPCMVQFTNYMDTSHQVGFHC